MLIDLSKLTEYGIIVYASNVLIVLQWPVLCQAVDLPLPLDELPT